MIRRAVTALAAVPAATLPDSAFLSALGTQRPEWSHHNWITGTTRQQHQTIPNNMVLWQSLVTCRRAPSIRTAFRGILPFRYTCKSIAFWQSCHFRKKGHYFFRGRKHIAFLVPQGKRNTARGKPELQGRLDCSRARTAFRSTPDGCGLLGRPF